jgi:hypothetical protein
MTDHESDLAQLKAEVQRLRDIQEIETLKARYFRYVDLHRWPELRELFTDDATFEIAESTSSPNSVDEFIGAIDRHLSQAMSVHHGHMPEITIVDGENAHGIWAMYDLVEPPTDSSYPLLTGYGHYTEEYRKVDGEWRIARLRLTRLKRSVDGTVDIGTDVNGRRTFIEPASKPR